MLHRIVPIVLVALCAAAPIAVADEQLPGAGPLPGVALTVYSDFGIVQDTRAINLPDRTATVSFTDVAKSIEPTSVHFTSLTDPTGTAVLEQNYEYDLVNADKLLTKYIDQRIAVLTVGGERFEGKLLSFDADQLVLQGNKGLYMIQRTQNVRNIEFPKLPEELRSRPALIWKIATSKPGDQLVRITYHADGLGWAADYTARLNPDETQIDLSGWVTLNNTSGAAYKDAQLKLMAGDVHRAGRRNHGSSIFSSQPSAGFDTESFFEYHLYTLKQRTTIADNQIKQIELLSAQAVPVVKRYVFEPEGPRQEGRPRPDACKVNVYVEFANNVASHLGMALPAGKVRVYKNTTEGDSEFIGEDEINHTPRDEKAKLYVGDVFDVVGERTILDADEANNWWKRTMKIELRNHKDTPVTILVREHCPRAGKWTISNASTPFKDVDAFTKEVEINVPANGKSELTFISDYYAK